MPTPKQDFEIVLNECLRSLVPVDVSAVFEHESFAQDTEAYINSLTSPKRIAHDAVPLGNMVLIAHPSEPEFTEEDAADIVKVRFLGDLIIKLAERKLEQNTTFKEETRGKDNLSAIMDFLHSGKWYHKQTDLIEREQSWNGHDASVAHPDSLAEWPKGNYINCLGAAIGAAAMCNLNNKLYMFGSELRTGDDYYAERHQNIRSGFARIYPGIFEDLTAKSIAKNQRLFEDKPEKEYDDLMFAPNSRFDVSKKARDFHHFIVAREPQGWIQVDPYAITVGWLNGETSEHDLVIASFDRKVDIANVALYEASRDEGDVHDIIERCIPALRKNAKEFDTLFANPKRYKSTTFMGDAFDVARAAAPGLATAFTMNKTTGITNTEMGAILEDGISTAWTAMLMTFIVDKPGSEKLIQDMVAHPTDDNGKVQVKAYQQASLLVSEQLQTDSARREQMLQNIKRVPAQVILNVYVHRLQTTGLLTGNVACTAMELSMPEFMIGAMYMNHYATYRKDGKINVARHLAQLSPSQLLWQSAQQDNCEGDERIKEVGKVISTLQPRHLHPLVNIARHLSQVTTL